MILELDILFLLIQIFIFQILWPKVIYGFSLIDIFCHSLTHLQMSTIFMCCICNYIVSEHYLMWLYIGGE